MFIKNRHLTAGRERERDRERERERERERRGGEGGFKHQVMQTPSSSSLPSLFSLLSLLHLSLLLTLIPPCLPSSLPPCNIGVLTQLRSDTINCIFLSPSLRPYPLPPSPVLIRDQLMSNHSSPLSSIPPISSSDIALAQSVSCVITQIRMSLPHTHTHTGLSKALGSPARHLLI